MAMSTRVKRMLRRARRLSRKQRGRRFKRRSQETIAKIKAKLKQQKAQVKFRRKTREKARPQREAKARAKREQLAQRIGRIGRKTAEVITKIRESTPTGKVERAISPRTAQARRTARETAIGVGTGGVQAVITKPRKALVSAGLGYATGGVGKVLTATKRGQQVYRTAGLGLTGVYGYQKGKEITAQPDPFSKGQVIGESLATEIYPFTAGYPKGQRHLQQTVGLFRTRGRKELKGLTPTREEGTFPTADPKEHFKIFQKGEHLREKAKPFIEKGKKPVAHVTGQEFKPTGELGGGIRGFKGLFTSIEPSSYFGRISRGKFKFPAFYKRTVAGGYKPTVYIAQARGFIKPKARGVGEKIKEYEKRTADKKGFVTETTAEIESVFKPQKYQTKKTKYYTKIEGVRVPVEKLKFKGESVTDVSPEFKLPKELPKARPIPRVRRGTRDRYSLTQESGLLYRRPSGRGRTRPSRRGEREIIGFDIPPREQIRTTPPPPPPRVTIRDPPPYRIVRDPPPRIYKTPPPPPPPIYPSLRFPSRLTAGLKKKKKKRKFKQPKAYKPTVYAVTRKIKATPKKRKKGKKLTKSGLGVRPYY